ncbi:MAG: zeta toxin family protein [Candidatus Omnitrophota bacterium]|nr:zeta toxin family protein [Candidatus Omnitrophota bacterium]
MAKQNVYVIAGPNGSGKTTFAREFLPKYAHCSNFVNADLIAQGLSPFSPYVVAIKAGKLLLEQIHKLADKNVEFAFETTLAGKRHAIFLKELKEKGYAIHLFFLWIPSKELALARIKERVARGGHNVADEDVRRRFDRSINNFLILYKPLLDTWNLFDNSTANPRLIAKEEYGKLSVEDKDLFDLIAKKAE